ncbi:hypothetical protein RRU01S_22_00070 [Agrobacterium rubi TR3 = NBRC 13261]|uniref:Uncharacterized protein n=2 Tax=Agrobacterium rubi TaxID=28099 RepID=A0A081CYX8_9HYPH|nr:hypothetical protein RRU01S_22_00070 [Agrobacterium rubi TR3 = NBRC 13261]
MEYDHGDLIEGYVIPDGFSDEATVVVTTDDGTRILLPCDQLRPAVVQSGRHATGLVGFRLDTSLIANLHQQQRLSIYDLKSGLLVYRRVPEESTVNLKILRLELKMLPMIKLDAFCGNRFQYAISSVERFGHETTLQVLHLSSVPSIYISGRVLFRNYEDFLDKGFQAITDVPDPYYEMASRLFIIKRLAKDPVTFVSDRDKLILAPAAEHFSNVNLEDGSEIKRALKKSPDKVRSVLASPITRQLVCTYPEQRVTRRDVAAAVGTLARFTVVGHGNQDGHFQDVLGELVGVSSMDVPINSTYKIIDEIAERLREIPIAEQLLEEDLILDHYLREAVA